MKPPAKQSYKPKIFLLDDVFVVLKTLGDLLRNNNFEVLTDDASAGLDAIIEKIIEFGPHVLITDIVLTKDNKFSGIDVIKEARRLERGKKISRLKIIATSVYGDSELVSSLSATPVDKAVSKSFSITEFIKIIDNCLQDLAREKKESLLCGLLVLAKHEKLVASWQNIVDVKGGQTPGSHIIFTGIDKKLKDIRLIGLYLAHTAPQHGSCLSVSFGCPRSCPICASGTQETYKRNYTAGEMVAMQELIMRECVFYNNNFWLYDMPFFAAFMGQGDIAFNFEETIKAAEIMKHRFGDRFVCNLSTAFIAGIKQLINYVKTNPIPQKTVISNLQISVHAPDKALRRRLVDSEEDPREIIRLGQEYARLTGTKITVNYGLTTINSEPEHIKAALNLLDPNVSRIKFTLMVMPDKSLQRAPKNAFAIGARLAERSKINYELFNERCQMGLETGASCGTLINKII